MLEATVRKQVATPGAKTSHTVLAWESSSFYSWLTPEPTTIEIEADNVLGAVRLAMQQLKTDELYEAHVVSSEKSVKFRNVQMQGDTVNFAYYQTQQLK